MVNTTKVDAKAAIDEATAEAKTAVAAEKAAKANKQEMPISITERRKAEELLREKFQNLKDGLSHEVQLKRGELHDVWQREKGIDKIKAKIQKHEDELAKLEKQLKVLCFDGEKDRFFDRSGSTEHVPAFRKACRALDDAENRAREELNEQENNIRQKLWLGILSDGALELLESIPTMSQLRSNGLSILNVAPKKLLGMTPGAKPVKKGR